MLSTDLVAELRAEVARWWSTVRKQQQKRRQGPEASTSTAGNTGPGAPVPGPGEAGPHGASILTPILGAMLGDGPIRMISLGQELSTDMDEKTLGEMQFKDNQVSIVFQFLL